MVHVGENDNDVLYDNVDEITVPHCLCLYIRNLCTKNKFYWHLKCLQLSECIYVGCGIKFEIVPKYSKHASHIIELFWRKSIIHHIVIIYFPRPRKISLNSRLSSSFHEYFTLYIVPKYFMWIVGKNLRKYPFKYFIFYIVLKYFMCIAG